MRPTVAVLVLAALVGSLPAAEPDVRKTIGGGLKFLAEEAVAWQAERKCSSCHHIPMTIWALNEAKRRGYVVDDKAVATTGRTPCPSCFRAGALPRARSSGPPTTLANTRRSGAWESGISWPPCTGTWESTPNAVRSAAPTAGRSRCFNRAEAQSANSRQPGEPQVPERTNEQMIKNRPTGTQ